MIVLGRVEPHALLGNALEEDQDKKENEKPRNIYAAFALLKVSYAESIVEV